MAKRPNRIEVNLSQLPRSVQDAVGKELALSIARNMKFTSELIVVGKLAPGTYGIIAPDLSTIEELQNLAKER